MLLYVKHYSTGKLHCFQFAYIIKDNHFFFFYIVSINTHNKYFIPHTICGETSHSKKSLNVYFLDNLKICYTMLEFSSNKIFRNQSFKSFINFKLYHFDLFSKYIYGLENKRLIFTYAYNKLFMFTKNVRLHLFLEAMLIFCNVANIQNL